MLILRRRWEYWVCATALHKIGATLIPGSLQLTKKDLIYRANAAKIHMIVCINDDFVIRQVEEAMPETPSLVVRALVAGTKEGWLDFSDELTKYPPVFERPAGEKAQNGKA